jgi:glycosyltransferase involved in cell wall biosynthesis
MGAWGAMQAGIRYAQAKGYQAVITMDADGQHEVNELPRLLSMRDEADLVIGAYAARASRARRIAWRWFIHLTGLDLEDLTSGFRYYNKAAMRILASEEATLLDYQDLGTLLMIRKAGLRIAEVPVAMKLRTLGKSRIFNSWFSVGRYMALTTLLCLSRWRVKRAAVHT